MESWLKYNFSKRKKVEILNYLHSWADLETKIYIMYTGSKIRPKETLPLPISDSYNQVKTIDYVKKTVSLGALKKAK